MEMETDDPRQMALQKSDIDKLWRFLLYGSPKSFKIPMEHDLSTQCTAIIRSLIQKRQGHRVIEAIRKASGCTEESFKDEFVPASCSKYPLLYALAVCICSKQEVVVREAYKCVVEICDIPSYLFLFLNLYYRMYKGQNHKKPSWPRGLRNVVRNWYTRKCDPMKLARMVTKYRNRYGWSHKKVLKLAHLRPPTEEYAFVFHYVRFGMHAAKEKFPQNLEVKKYLMKVEFVRTFKFDKQSRPSQQETTNLLDAIRSAGLNWEHLPTGMLKSPDLLKHIVGHMPVGALLRNLGRISTLGLLGQSGSPTEAKICEHLRSKVVLLKAKVHPLTILKTASQYGSGGNQTGTRTWNVNENVHKALWEAFQGLASSAIHATGKRLLLGINVNTGMSCPVIGSPILSSKMAAVALSKLLYDIEIAARNGQVSCVQFPNANKAVSPVEDDARMIDLSVAYDIRSITKKLHDIKRGTDCKVPFRYAIKQRLAVDAFIIFTDFIGPTHIGTLKDELHRYQRESRIVNAKLVIVSLSNFDFIETDDENILGTTGVDIVSLVMIRDFVSESKNELLEMLK